MGLLVSSGANVNCQDTYGRKPLKIAARNGYDKVVKLLLDQHAVADDCGETGWAVLQVASLESHREVVTIFGNALKSSILMGGRPLYISVGGRGPSPLIT